MDLFTVLRVKADLDGIAESFAENSEPTIRERELGSSEVILALITVHMGINGQWYSEPTSKVLPYLDAIALLREAGNTYDIEGLKRWYALKASHNFKILIVIIGNVGIPFEVSAYAFPPLNQSKSKPKIVEGEYNSSKDYKYKIGNNNLRSSSDIVEAEFDFKLKVQQILSVKENMIGRKYSGTLLGAAFCQEALDTMNARETDVEKDKELIAKGVLNYINKGSKSARQNRNKREKWKAAKAAEAAEANKLNGTSGEEESSTLSLTKNMAAGLAEVSSDIVPTLDDVADIM